VSKPPPLGAVAHGSGSVRVCDRGDANPTSTPQRTQRGTGAGAHQGGGTHSAAGTGPPATQRGTHATKTPWWTPLAGDPRRHQRPPRLRSGRAFDLVQRRLASAQTVSAGRAVADRYRPRPVRGRWRVVWVGAARTGREVGRLRRHRTHSERRQPAGPPPRRLRCSTVPPCRTLSPRRCVRPPTSDGPPCRHRARRAGARHRLVSTRFRLG
jgi:hypothetical protein